MQTPLQIRYRHLDPSETLDQRIQEEAAKLEQFSDRIIACRVTVEQPHHHHWKGRHFRVRIELSIPGTELVVNRDPVEHADHEDPLIAVNEAFHALARKLEDAVRRDHHKVKRHEEAPVGIVSSLSLDREFGFLRTPDGREVYFHRNSVLDGGFDQLKVGAQVRFVEELGERGPQASTVHPVG